MSQKSCFFIGHRETPEEIYPVLCAAVEEHIVRYGVTEFIVGRYGCFDGLAAKAVKNAKQTHPEVELTLLLPYHPAERPIPVPDGFDSTYYPPGMEWSEPCSCDTMRRLWIAANQSVLQADTLSSPVPPDTRL